jgi:uncharacterized protein (TIGR02246 family)
MLRVLKNVLASFVVFSVLVGFATTVSARGNVRASIEANNKRWEKAARQGNAAGIAALYTRTAKLILPNNKVVSGRKAITDYWQAAIDAGFKGMKLTAVEVEAHGDIAYEVGRYSVPGQGGKVFGAGEYVVIWKRANGQWKLHRDIWTTSAAASRQ